MIYFTNLDEFSRLKGSEPILEKIEDIMAFIREKGINFDISSYPSFTLEPEKKTLSFCMKITIPLPSP